MLKKPRAVSFGSGLPFADNSHDDEEANRAVSHAMQAMLKSP
jgi:hypothetical protein